MFQTIVLATVAVEITAETNEAPINLIPEAKAGLAKMPARQVLKLISLALALIAWYPIYHELDPFSRFS